MTNSQSGKSISVENWPTWKLVAVVAPSYSVFGAIVAFVPTYSQLALAVGAAMTAGSVVATILGSKTKSWYVQTVLVGLLHAMIILIGARHWAVLLPMPWVSYLVHIVLYLLMWALPAIAPKLSAFIEREGRNPETRLGLGCFRVSLLLLPVGGAAGAMIAMYGFKYGLDNWVNIFIGVAGTVGGLGLLQYFAHHLWQERPWAGGPDSARQVERT